MHSARQASARMVIEARSHRRVAGGLAAGKGSGAGGRTDMRRATASDASRDTSSMPEEGDKTVKKHVVCQCPRSESGTPPCLTRYSSTRVKLDEQLGATRPIM